MTPLANKLCAAVAAVVLATAVAAEPGPVGNWLMKDSVSLLDWGLYQAQRDMDAAAQRLQNNNESNEPVKEGDVSIWARPPRFSANARYDWDDNEIVLSLAINVDPDDYSRLATHDECNRYRQNFLRQLGIFHYEESVKVGLGPDWVVDRWFSHSGFKRGDRPEGLGKKLSRIVWVEVEIWGWSNQAGIAGSFHCKGRIAESEAPSKPLRRQSQAGSGVLETPFS